MEINLKVMIFAVPNVQCTFALQMCECRFDSQMCKCSFTLQMCTGTLAPRMCEYTFVSHNVWMSIHPSRYANVHLALNMCECAFAPPNMWTSICPPNMDSTSTVKSFISMELVPTRQTQCYKGISFADQVLVNISLELLSCQRLLHLMKYVCWSTTHFIICEDSLFFDWVTGGTK